MTGSALVLHATTIALRRDGIWRGVLLQGPSGAGKSDLALRAMQAGWRLVADDRTLIWRSGGRLFGRPHPRLAGLVEARGIGVVSTPALHFAQIGLLAHCRPAAEIERLPDPQTTELLAVPLPTIDIAATEAAAPAKLALSLMLQSVRFDTCRNERIEPWRGREDPMGAGALGVRKRN